MASNVEMKMGNINAVKGGVVIGLVSGLIRWLSWFFIINGNKKVVDDAKELTGMLIIAGCIIPLVSFLLMYHSYAQKGMQAPMKLRTIAQGGAWVMPGFIILLAAEGLLFVGVFAGMSVLYGRFVSKAVTCAVIGFAADVVLFFVGKIFFKPDLIQKA